MTYTVVTFYKFVSLADLEIRRESLEKYCQDRQIKGTILLATEGINGTIAGNKQAIDEVRAYLQGDRNLADLEFKESTAKLMPFARLKVKIKSEIVTLGIPKVDPNQRVGTYVRPQEWNQIISDPEVTVIDTRNDYEVEIGSFKGAIDPKTDSFREFPQYVAENLDPNQHPKVAMFCTGGIRCEKASSYLLSQGFKEVYHLQGGILKYLEQVPSEESLWEGECFVFDERVAVKSGLTSGSYDLCYACGHPISETDKASPRYEPSISCPYCYDDLTPEKKARQLNRQRQREYNQQNNNH
ncbi:MAG: rhodanese-related sulfurtransferase [Pleurocapsa sp.]